MNGQEYLTAVLDGDPEQQAMCLARFVRDGIEEFHVKHLTDEQMAELNPLIRGALYYGIRLIYAAQSDDEDADLAAGARFEIAFGKAPPSYWEPIQVDLYEEGGIRELREGGAGIRAEVARLREQAG